MPQVTVIIPAFNAEATILEAVRSVRAQTFIDWELIVVDDGSTDTTRRQLAALDDRRIRVVAGDHGGVARARNLGLAHAEADLITFLDADDLWTTDKIDRQVAMLRERPEAGAVYSWTAFVDRQGRFLFAKEPSQIEGRIYGELLVTFFLASGSNVMARRAFLTEVGGFDEASEPVEDWEFWLRVSDRCAFAVVPRYQVLYRFGVASASSDVERYHAAVARVAGRAFAAAPAALQARHGECLSNAKQHACMIYLTRTTAPERRRRAATLFFESLGLHPAAVTSRRTIALAIAWLLLLPMPSRLAPRAAGALLRLYGRSTARGVSELRDAPRGTDARRPRVAREQAIETKAI